MIFGKFRTREVTYHIPLWEKENRLKHTWGGDMLAPKTVSIFCAKLSGLSDSDSKKRNLRQSATHSLESPWVQQCGPHAWLLWPPVILVCQRLKILRDWEMIFCPKKNWYLILYFPSNIKALQHVYRHFKAFTHFNWMIWWWSIRNILLNLNRLFRLSMGGAYAQTIHSLKLTANAPENRPKPKRKRSYSNHPFSGAMFNYIFWNAGNHNFM